MEDAQKLRLFEAIKYQPVSQTSQKGHLVVANELLLPVGVAKGMQLTAFQRQPIESGTGVEQLKAAMNVALPHVLLFTTASAIPISSGYRVAAPEPIAVAATQMAVTCPAGVAAG